MTGSYMDVDVTFDCAAVIAGHFLTIQREATLGLAGNHFLHITEVEVDTYYCSEAPKGVCQNQHVDHCLLPTCSGGIFCYTFAKKYCRHVKIVFFV